MKVSELWLKEWINSDIDTNKLIEMMTMSGFKVNSLNPIINNFSEIIIGKIIQYDKHPNIRDLAILKIDIGDLQPINVISNINNCSVDLKVVIAKSGSNLFKDQKAKITNINAEYVSEGIICSYEQLGIINHEDDIIIPPQDALVGSNFENYLKFKHNDNIIDISIPINRGDCLSLLGIARDISAINKLHLKRPEFFPVKPTINDRIIVNIHDVHKCPCYVNRIIKNINNKISTPLWMKEKLKRSGIYCINAITDIIHYVVVELGYPINILDLDKIVNTISIRLAKDQEKIQIDNNKEIKLKQSTLVTVDKKQILSLTGILNIKDVNINSSTSNILLECAFIYPPYFLEKEKQYKLQTDSSYRYGRGGIDPNIITLAIERATYYLIKICGGCPGPIINIGNIQKISKPHIIKLREYKIKQLIGYFISDNEIQDILLRVGCNIIKHFNKIWEILIPTWRHDLILEEDIIEEIVRFYGYNKLPKTSLRTNLKLNNINNKKFSLLRIKNLLVDRGYQEVITYSFVDPKIQNLLYPNTKSIKIINPISKKMSVLRLSLWSSLINTVIYNQNRQQQKIKLFESGMIFLPNEKSITNEIKQHFMLAGIITGIRHEEHWDYKKINIMDFYDIKGDVETILKKLNKLEDIQFKTNNYHSGLHPGKNAFMYLNDEYIGCFGSLHPMLEKTLQLNYHTLVFEFFWEKISKYKIPKINDIPKFPINRRDISIIVNENIAVKDIINECKNNLQNELIEIRLFDVYRGTNIKKGLKSITVSLFLCNKSYTLKEIEITKIINKCIISLQRKFQALLRK